MDEIDLSLYMSTPAGARLLAPGGERSSYTNERDNLPPSLRNLVTNHRSGAYLRGLGKAFSLSPDQVSQLAFIVLQVCVGKQEFKNMSAVIQQELGVSGAQANNMAADIEKELLAPVRKDLDEF